MKRTLVSTLDQKAIRRRDLRIDLQDIVWRQTISFVVYVDEVCEHAHCWYEGEELECSEEAEE